MLIRIRWQGLKPKETKGFDFTKRNRMPHAKIVLCYGRRVPVANAESPPFFPPASQSSRPIQTLSGARLGGPLGAIKTTS